MPPAARDDVGIVPYKCHFAPNFLLRRFSIYVTINYVWKGGVVC